MITGPGFVDDDLVFLLTRTNHFKKRSIRA